MKRLYLFVFTAILTIANLNSATAREQIRIVGSSTVFPFTSKAAEEFSQNSDFSAPIVESIGTGSGLKMFCSGVDLSTPDIANASRRIKQSERDLCKSNGVNKITEVKIGYDGIVIASDKNGLSIDLTEEIMFKALAKNVVKDGKLVENFYKNWSDINAKLPNKKILVYGPPPTSGTRDAFVELVMEKACKKLPEFKAKFKDKERIKEECHKIRSDGAYVEAGENDNIIIKKVTADKKAIGIFGYGFLEENKNKVKPLKYNGYMPEFKNILNGKYGISRSMYLYIKDAHVSKIPGVKEFLTEYFSENAMGEYGYLLEKGLIPLQNSAIEKNRKKILGLK